MTFSACVTCMDSNEEILYLPVLFEGQDKLPMQTSSDLMDILNKCRPYAEAIDLTPIDVYAIIDSHGEIVWKDEEEDAR